MEQLKQFKFQLQFLPLKYYYYGKFLLSVSTKKKFYFYILILKIIYGNPNFLSLLYNENLSIL